MRHIRRMAIVLLATAMAGCDRAQPGPPATPEGTPAQEISRRWMPIASWTGTGIRQSETFTMLRHEWRLRWEAKPLANGEDAALHVSVHSADSGRVLAEPIDHQGTGAGVVEVVEEPRQFYLTFEATGVEWSVAVEEARDGPVGPE